MEARACAVCGEQALELQAVHLSVRGAAQTFACTRCGVLVDQAAQMDPAPGMLEGVDRRPGLDFTVEDLTEAERSS